MGRAGGTVSWAEGTGSAKASRLDGAICKEQERGGVGEWSEQGVQLEVRTGR